MGFKDVKIGGKLIIAFVTVIVIFGGILTYQVASIRKLTQLQDEGAGRADDALTLNDIKIDIGEIYPVIADAVINRDLEASFKDFEKIRELAEENITVINDLVDTDAEKEMARDAAASYSEYIEVAGDQMLPIIASSTDSAQRAADQS